MVSPIGSSTQASGSDALVGAVAPAPQKPMDKEAFLKLLVAQIKNQDPLKPMENTEMVAQLSQFAMVEQALSQTNQLNTLSTQLNGIASNEATTLVGKNVTVRGKSLSFDGITAQSTAITLAGPAQKVTANIVDADGKVVRSIELGARPAGAVPIVWDGKDANGNTAAKGTYSLKIDATDSSGAAVSSTQDVSGTVVKVTFDKGYPELTLSNGATCPISDLVGVEAPITQQQK